MRPFVPPWRPFADLLSNARIIFYSDNQNVDFILLNGSRKLDPVEAFQTCLKYRISLDTRWIPRVLNVRVDSIRKLIDFDDYAINDFVFQSINDHWGLHTVDRFACSYNTKFPRFNFRFFQPGCEAVDAFSQDWEYDNWLCPPVCLIVRILKHMEVCLARGTLILPLWKSSFLLNVCATDGVHWSRSFLIGSTCPSSRDYLSKGKPVIAFLASDPFILMLLLCESSFAIPGPLSRGVLHFALWKVTLLIRRYFS